ncbi:uncharacterized protein F5Z01DRAFT_640733 [Emericellopsis atlantica]|uniref:Uncharacterized protein n=1 Tax=Emericellopsis atlantica TaxID=2614577 RepID=A0A9P7ZE85_9HYPO|nr:uncharacterized protein F5Z01DRAFT_640733 [Emericellopsis atlantica]KAG9249935.1 hypothetical protein F5Z01DRAFT_640733 [Emericellopsis atlantica]
MRLSSYLLGCCQKTLFRTTSRTPCGFHHAPIASICEDTALKTQDSLPNRRDGEQSARFTWDGLADSGARERRGSRLARPSEAVFRDIKEPQLADLISGFTGAFHQLEKRKPHLRLTQRIIVGDMAMLRHIHANYVRQGTSDEATWVVSVLEDVQSILDQSLTVAEYREDYHMIAKVADSICEHVDRLNPGNTWTKENRHLLQRQYIRWNHMPPETDYYVTLGLYNTTSQSRALERRTQFWCEVACQYQQGFLR